MRVLVTGARGFVGKNLCCALKNIRDGKDRREKYASLLPLEVMEYDIESTLEELDGYCSRADFVFNLAGVNRPKDQSEYMEGNFGFASTLLETLERHGNKCPIMLSSSAQASLSGRFEGSVYGESKLAGGCSYSFVNWAMLFSRLNRDMLTPGLSADGLQSVRSASTRRRRAPCPA